MSIIKFKSTVQTPKVVIIVAALVNAANALGLKEDMFVTSCNDSVHAKGSAHYTDEAADFRLHHLQPADKHRLADALKARLGSTFTVLIEDEGLPNEHLHCQVAIAFRRSK